MHDIVLFNKCPFSTGINIANNHHHYNVNCSIRKFVNFFPLFSISLCISSLQAVMCDRLNETIDNGSVNVTCFYFNCTATYYCDLGYTLNGGNESLTCMADGNWSSSPPECECKEE